MGPLIWLAATTPRHLVVVTSWTVCSATHRSHYVYLTLEKNKLLPSQLRVHHSVLENKSDILTIP